MKSVVAAAALSLSVLAAAPALASPFTALYAFGDSLSDAGNIYVATGGAIPGSPYYQGRFSNGPNWIDTLSAAYGLGPVTPSLANGNNFAFGDATTGNAVPGAVPGIPDINQQVGAFTARTGGSAPSSALYTVWIGGNDVANALAAIAGNTLTVPAAITAVQAAAGDAATAVATLANEGAKSFVVPLVPDLGQTPNVTDFPPLVPLASALSEAFNAALVAAIATDTAGKTLDLHYLDAYALIDAAVASPGTFGLTNATQRCYIGSLLGGGTVCATPDTYLFWDGDHPTTTVHTLVAGYAQLAIPEPSTIAALVTGVLGLVATRGRTRRRAADARQRAG